jgi:hypothetical protein
VAQSFSENGTRALRFIFGRQPSVRSLLRDDTSILQQADSGEARHFSMLRLPFVLGNYTTTPSLMRDMRVMTDLSQDSMRWSSMKIKIRIPHRRANGGWP